MRSFKNARLLLLSMRRADTISCSADQTRFINGELYVIKIKRARRENILFFELSQKGSCLIVILNKDDAFLESLVYREFLNAFEKLVTAFSLSIRTRVEGADMKDIIHQIIVDLEIERGWGFEEPTVLLKKGKRRKRKRKREGDTLTREGPFKKKLCVSAKETELNFVPYDMKYEQVGTDIRFEYISVPPTEMNFSVIVPTMPVFPERLPSLIEMENSLCYEDFDLVSEYFPQEIYHPVFESSESSRDSWLEEISEYCTEYPHLTHIEQEYLY
eukprot:TRINITY_DN1294_c0_g1_i4.p1 TRINITY_DN1294_c0_g1~~TRINITY_DN1294_c0_g1_i4.p1  ORF type:complete len:273 (-),score=41.89 TRINITY_DN1294_c0_g1_i4:56-874(-)